MIKKFLADVFLDTQPTNSFVIKEKGDQTRAYLDQIENLYLSQVLIAYKYDDGLRAAHHAFKYFQNQTHLSGFSHGLWWVLDAGFSPQPDEKVIIVPVPIHWRKRLKRGQNHSLRLAKRLSELTGHPMLPLLQKSRHTQKQAGLSQDERESNLLGSLSLSPGSGLKWATIILVDDIISTGSTANLCAKILKESGARRVVGVFLASTLKNK